MMVDDAGRAFAWLIACLGLTAAITVLSVPYGIGQHGLAGLWIPAVLFAPMLLLAAGLRALRRCLALPGDPPR